MQRRALSKAAKHHFVRAIETQPPSRVVDILIFADGARPDSATDLGEPKVTWRSEMGSRGSAGGRNLKRSGVIEEAWTLDARELQRRGILEHGWSARVNLRHHSGRTALIEFECDHERIQLTYDIKVAPNHSVPKKITIELSRVPRHFGGAQTYLMCPGCAKRVALMYLADGNLVCRVCADLVHSSSREGAADRALRRSHKRWARVGGGHGFFAGVPVRPAHMRMRTFYATLRKIRAAEPAFAKAWLPHSRPDRRWLG